MPIYHLIAGFPASVSPSSHAVESDDGQVYLTGQFGRDLRNPEQLLPDGIEAQTDRTLSNMASVLRGLGLDMGCVLSVRVFLTHFHRDYEAMNRAYARHFPLDARPARTCVGVHALVRDALIEIDCIAQRPRGGA